MPAKVQTSTRRRPWRSARRVKSAGAEGAEGDPAGDRGDPRIVERELRREERCRETAERLDVEAVDDEREEERQERLNAPRAARGVEASGRVQCPCRHARGSLPGRVLAWRLLASLLHRRFEARAVSGSALRKWPIERATISSFCTWARLPAMLFTSRVFSSALISR